MLQWSRILQLPRAHYYEYLAYSQPRYKLYRNDGDGGPATRLLGIFPPTSRGYNDTNLFADRNFQYVLFATNGDDGLPTVVS